MQSEFSMRDVTVVNSMDTQSISNGIYNRLFKRPLDFAIALAALVLLSPVLLIIALLIKIKLGSPVIFSTEAAG